MPKQKKTRLELEALAVGELRKIAGCDEAVSVTINRQTGGQATWTLTTYNPGRSDVKLCGDALVPIIVRMQQQYDFVDDPIGPMPQRL